MKNKIISGFAVIFFLSCSDNSSLEFPSEKEWLEKWFPGSSSSALLGSSSSVPVGSSSSTGSSSSIGSSVGSAARSCGTDKTYEPANQICDERDTPKVYNIMTVEGKTWMAENLNYAASGSKCGTG
ncbi:MAG: hypothetical protein LBC64_00170, partial [Fibromonadaceae bacterium]|nr:hypothetical protein [Fibromonadaceae bacterium]